MLHVALYQPKIPPNTGNAARTCAGMAAHLHLVGPHAFDLSEHAVKRAGLDYWPHVTLTEHPGPDAFFEWVGPRRVWLVTKFGEHRFDRPDYRDDDVLLFGSEKLGLPPEVHDRYPGHRIHIPMSPRIRSFNLANTVAIVLAVATATAGLDPTRAT